jgi:hypothetical protein
MTLVLRQIILLIRQQKKNACAKTRMTMIIGTSALTCNQQYHDPSIEQYTRRMFIQDENEHVIKITPYTHQPSKFFKETYNTTHRSCINAQDPGCWSANSNTTPFVIWCFSSESQNYHPTETTTLHYLRENGNGPIAKVYYWATHDTLVIQSIAAFPSLQKIMQKHV